MSVSFIAVHNVTIYSSICSHYQNTHICMFTISECLHFYVHIIRMYICSYIRFIHHILFFGIAVAEKTEVIKRLGFFGLVFFLLSIAFSIIGGIGITTFQQEHEWHSRFSSQIYCGSLVAGVLVNIRFEKI